MSYIPNENDLINAAASKLRAAESEEQYWNEMNTPHGIYKPKIEVNANINHKGFRARYCQLVTEWAPTPKLAYALFDVLWQEGV